MIPNFRPDHATVGWQYQRVVICQASRKDEEVTMKFLRVMTAATFFAFGAHAASALDLGAMSDNERADFRAEVRSYLLDNPEVLMEAISVLEERQAEAARANEAAVLEFLADSIFDDGFSWVGGNPDGDITLVEFSDYRCGYCRQAHPEIEQLLQADGNIRFILKEFPILGEQSTISSQFAIAVKELYGDEMYKEIHDALITMRTDSTPENLERLAIAFDLDPSAISDEMQSERTANIINANHQLASQLQITGTPTFVLRDQLLRGYLPLAEMQKRVDAAREAKN